MAAGVVLITQAVQPAINVPRDHLLNSDLVYGDETTVQVLKEPRRNAQIGCAPGRGAVYATKLYAGIRPGAMLITDGYEVYKSIARVSTLTYVGCWVHARRPFIRAEEALLKTARSPEQITSRFVRLIGKLYRVGPWQGTQGAHAA